MGDKPQPKKKKVALNIQIDEEDHEFLTWFSEAKGISAAGLVRMIIKEYRNRTVHGQTDQQKS